MKRALYKPNAAIAAAKDGGKKAIAEKKKERTALIKLLRTLGHYVEANCKVLRFAPIGADGKPGTWTEVGLTNPRAIPVNGLTPGTN